MVRNNKGFSLVELMVVVAIIGILSAIAIPQINKYMARARQSEAKLNLAAIYTGTKAFFAEYGAYDNRFDVIGYRPEGQMRYNVGWAAAGARCTLPSFGFNPTPPPVDRFNAVTQCAAMPAVCTVLAGGQAAIIGSAFACADAGAKTFTAGAIGRIGTGAATDQWTMTDSKTLTNTADGTL